MSEAKQAWDDVGNRFAELGQHVKNRFDANIAFADEDREKVDDALRKLLDSLDNAFSAIGESMRDPTVREQLKGTATAMGNALTTTFREVSEEIQARLKKQ